MLQTSRFNQMGNVNTFQWLGATKAKVQGNNQAIMDRKTRISSRGYRNNVQNCHLIFNGKHFQECSQTLLFRKLLEVTKSKSIMSHRSQMSA
jgi:hypothetical protein